MTMPLSYAMADVLILTNHFSSIVPNIIEKLLRYLASYGRYYMITHLLLWTFYDKNAPYLVL